MGGSRFALELLRPDHAGMVLAFERENREWFARSISDRGDEYFDHFEEKHASLLTDQEAGRGAYFIAVDDGSVLGRFNLIFPECGRAVLGYRVAERTARRGVATSAVEELCGLARTSYDVREVLAATSNENVASQRVLAKAGFEMTGPADPADIGGKQGSWWRRDLADGLPFRVS